MELLSVEVVGLQGCGKTTTCTKYAVVNSEAPCVDEGQQRRPAPLQEVDDEERPRERRECIVTWAIQLPLARPVLDEQAE